MSVTPCPNCGYDDFEIIDDKPEFTIRVCHACLQTYDVSRTPEEIKQIEAEQAAAAKGLHVGWKRVLTDGRTFEIKKIYWYQSRESDYSAVHMNVLTPEGQVRIYRPEDFDAWRWEDLGGYVDVPVYSEGSK